ncbi:helix-turn-helix domain-containing protein [[Pasteurella] aerogenes]|nr:helix-turn-helix domain-containing protein [[Pasteurella] aerogenes]
MEKYYSVKELVDCGLASESTIFRLIRNKKLKSFKFGRSRKIPESEVKAYISSCNSSNSPSAHSAT